MGNLFSYIKKHRYVLSNTYLCFLGTYCSIVQYIQGHEAYYITIVIGKNKSAIARDVVSGYLDIQAILAIHYPNTKKVEISKYPNIHDIQLSMYPSIRIHKKLRYPTIQVSKHWIVG